MSLVTVTMSLSGLLGRNFSIHPCVRWEKRSRERGRERERERENEQSARPPAVLCCYFGVTRAFVFRIRNIKQANTQLAYSCFTVLHRHLLLLPLLIFFFFLFLCFSFHYCLSIRRAGESEIGLKWMSESLYLFFLFLVLLGPLFSGSPRRLQPV